MSYNYHTEITSRNHSGPRGVAITGITWHHWGDDGLFNDSQDDDEARGIAKYLSRSGGNTSAHIVISGRDVFQIVPDAMYAWHAGNSEGNRRTIGIEVDPDAEKQKDTYQTCAEVARDLEKHYGRLRFYRHSDWKNTACPGDLDTGRIRRLADANPAPDTIQEDDMDAETKAKIDAIFERVTTKVIDGPAGKPKEQDRLTLTGALRRLLIEVGATLAELRALRRDLNKES